MVCSRRRILDGLAMALLLFVAGSQVRGAVVGSTRVLSVVLLIISVFCCVGIFMNSAKVRTLAGCFLIVLAVLAALVMWRLHTPVVPSFVMCGAFAVIGAGNLLVVRGDCRRSGSLIKDLFR